jgi:hypothetical protein
MSSLSHYAEVITANSIVTVMKGIDPFPVARAMWLQTRPLKSEKPAEPQLA